MRIHTDVLTKNDLCDCLPPDVWVEALLTGSRSRDCAYTVHLSGEGARHTRRANNGSRGAGYEHAATFSDWGRWINALYDRDPAALIGQYRNSGHFYATTCGIYDDSSDNSPQNLARAVRARVATGATKTGAIAVEARERGLSEWLVKHAIFGE